ncbi:MAG: cytochrome b/b6 domain-containing protein [Nocardioidaceae bacterium]|nr:cytochrome b/b6 domain-containing protein [Nocardioidaceae bacterium]
MPLNFRFRNGAHGYGLVTKTLHWLTVALLAAQFTVGYLMDDERGRGRGRGRGHGSGHGSGHGRGGDDFDRLDLLPVHVTLGVLILLVATARVAWRLGTDLPPWDERLGPVQRRIVHRTEQVLLASLFLVPGTGLALLLSGEDDLLWLHVSAHVLFFTALAAHLAMVLGKRLLPRML